MQTTKSLQAGEGKNYPCGKAGNVKMRDRILHYKMCNHEACIERLRVWDALRAEAAKPGAVSFQPGGAIRQN